jgi:hypothetical protein
MKKKAPIRPSTATVMGSAITRAEIKKLIIKLINT